MIKKRPLMITTNSLSVTITVLLFCFSLNSYAQKNKRGDTDNKNKFKTVTIGEQTWMAENLGRKSSRPTFYSIKYGQLYNYQSALKACPEGWHLPLDHEWTELEVAMKYSQQKSSSLGGANNGGIGTALKSKKGWLNGGGGTDSFGFNAQPGGYRSAGGPGQYGIEKVGRWWTASPKASTKSYIRSLHFNRAELVREGDYNAAGNSVRCLKDEDE